MKQVELLVGYSGKNFVNIVYCFIIILYFKNLTHEGSEYACIYIYYNMYGCIFLKFVKNYIMHIRYYYSHYFYYYKSNFSSSLKKKNTGTNKY